MTWSRYQTELLQTLAAISATGVNRDKLDIDEAFSCLVYWVHACTAKRRRVYFVGNGASASMASHFAADLGKVSGVATEIFSDAALITATCNDMGYEESFAYPLRQRMIPGEILIAISSSGNSPNVVYAIEAAREIGGQVVTFSAMSSENRIRSMGDLNFYIPAETYGMAESSHAAMLHFFVDRFTTSRISSK